MIFPSNQLGSEKSPYLLQHAANPVAWRAWGADVFADARREGRPIFLSIGYSTCHWCHVMERESFEDRDVAHVLNSSFIPVKVDREERPDVDAIYMDVLQRMTGHGGWPLSVWLTPDGEPFYAGTYFPREQFLLLLGRIAGAWTQDRDRIVGSAQEIAREIRESVRPKEGGASLALSGAAIQERFARYHHQRYDAEHGGFGEAPKFPPSMHVMALMRAASRVMQQGEALDPIIRGTLDAMALGGIYDHLGGGFHRYSTDAEWRVPHFEKMLYDNGLLILAYVEAWQRYADPVYARVARETCDYLLRDLQDTDGGFYSAEDADSLVVGRGEAEGEKEEGFYYTFAFDELRAALTPDELELCRDLYDVTPGGQLEGRNVLARTHSAASGLDAKAGDLVRNLNRRLLEIRSARPRPHLDKKIISGWNGIAIAALARAAGALDERRYGVAAARAAEFVWTHLWDGNRLARRWIDGESRHSACSEDYSRLILAFLNLYEWSFDPRWIDRAKTLQSALDRDFWDAAAAGYFRDDGRDPTLILRTKEEYDGARPAATSLGAHNLFRLGAIVGDASYRARALEILKAYAARLTDYPMTLPYLVMAAEFAQRGPTEVTLAGELNSPDGRAFLHELRSKFHPRAVVKHDPAAPAGIVCEARVCVEAVCLPPIRNPAALAQALE